jgi:hypothetical protein
MISLVVSDALQGTDIRQRYPAFYQRVQNDAELRQTFIDVLALAEASALGKLAPLPGPASRDLSFLKKVDPKPVVELAAPGRWRAIWRQNITHLQEMVRVAFSTPPDLAYRSTDPFLAAPWFTLLRSDMEVETIHLTALLEASQILTEAEASALLLAIGVTIAPTGNSERLPLLRAHLSWGNYNETTVVSERGRATFPLLSLAMVTDETRQKFTADLQLTLEPEFMP